MSAVDLSIVVSPGWDRGLIDALHRRRLGVVSPVGIERMPTAALSRAVQGRWRLVKRRGRTRGGRGRSPGRPLDDVRRLGPVLRSGGGRVPRSARPRHRRELRVMPRAFAGRGDIAPPAVAGWVYVHHHVQATRRGECALFTCAHPRLTVQEKWGEAAIRRWFFDPPLLVPPQLRSAPVAYLAGRALRFGKDLRRSLRDAKLLACGFPGAEELLAAVAREQMPG